MSRTPLPRIDNCDNCGACCNGQEALPVGYYLGAVGNKRKLPPALCAELESLAERFDREGWPANGEWCVWFDAATKRCKHYEHRPDVCRDAVKIGDEWCRMARAEEGIDPVRRFRLVNGRMREIV